MGSPRLSDLAETLIVLLCIIHIFGYNIMKILWALHEIAWNILRFVLHF